MVGFSLALRILDEVQHLAQLEAFDPDRFVAASRGAVPGARPGLAEVGGELDGVRGLLVAIDRFTQKTMRIRLNHLTDSLPPKLHTLLGSTIVAYERDPALLRERVAAMLGRAFGSTAAAMTDQVCDAAERVLAVRRALRQGVIGLVQEVAIAWLPATRRDARDRSQAEDERAAWGRARVDLEQLAARGETVETGSFAERLGKIGPPTEDPGDPEPEPDPTATRFSLLELD